MPLLASQQSGIDACIFKECKQTTRQVRLRKSGKKLRKSLGRAGWAVERFEVRTQAWHALRTYCHIKLPGAALVEAHLM